MSDWLSSAQSEGRANPSSSRDGSHLLHHTEISGFIRLLLLAVRFKAHHQKVHRIHYIQFKVLPLKFPNIVLKESLFGVEILHIGLIRL